MRAACAAPLADARVVPFGVPLREERAIVVVSSTMRVQQRKGLALVERIAEIGVAQGGEGFDCIEGLLGAQPVLVQHALAGRSFCPARGGAEGHSNAGVRQNAPSI